MTKEQIAAMLKDAETLERGYEIRRSAVGDVCCHVRALAAYVEELEDKLDDFKAHVEQLGYSEQDHLDRNLQGE